MIPTTVAQLEDGKFYAKKSDLPKKTSDLTNDSGFLTQHQSLENYVDKTSDQEIDGVKTFKQRPIINSATKIPSEYQRITYIESSGQQVIDTGFYPTGNSLQIDMKFRYTQTNGGLSLFGNNNGAPFSITIYGPQPAFYVGNSQGFICGPDSPVARDFDHKLSVKAHNGTITAD